MSTLAVGRRKPITLDFCTVLQCDTVKVMAGGLKKKKKLMYSVL